VRYAGLSSSLYGNLDLDLAMAKSPQIDEQYSAAETVRRRDATIKQMLNTPPQPRKTKPSRPKAASHKAKKSG
jgi:hypothetical protein